MLAPMSTPRETSQISEIWVRCNAPTLMVAVAIAALVLPSKLAFIGITRVWNKLAWAAKLVVYWGTLLNLAAALACICENS